MPEVKTYNSVTETPDTKATLDQLERIYSRYRFALDFCEGKDGECGGLRVVVRVVVRLLKNG